jgi:hypothetical protein
MTDTAGNLARMDDHRPRPLSAGELFDQAIAALESEQGLDLDTGAWAVTLDLTDGVVRRVHAERPAASPRITFGRRAIYGAAE